MNNPKKGIALIELLVALSIFFISSVAFACLLKTGSATRNSATSLIKAAYTLQSKAEEIRLASFEELNSLNGQSFAGGRGKILVSPVLSDLIKIELELTWDPKRLPLKIATLRSKY